MLIKLEPIGEIRWYAYQKLTNDMNISSHVHRLYMFFQGKPRLYTDMCILLPKIMHGPELQQNL